MSTFLAPIHYWLFNKIRLHEQLESNLLNAYKNKYGNVIDEIEQNSISIYSKPLGDKALEDNIELSNIHGWLQNTIAKTETRVAFILNEVLRRNGDEAFQIALNEFKVQGTLCGRDVKEKGIANTAPKIFKSLNDYLLDGMPCDRVNVVTVNTEDKIAWNTTECLHRGFWREAGASDLSLFYVLRFNWIKAFVSSANPDFEYSYEDGDNIESLFIHEIAKKSS